MTSKRRGVVQRAIAVALVLLAAACGSSIDDEPAAPASTTTTTTAAPSSSTTSEAPSTTTVAVTTTTIDAREEFDLANDGDDPLIFFGAVPPKPESVDSEIPLGSTGIDRRTHLLQQAGGITGVSRTAAGVGLALPEGTTYDIEYSADLVTWSVIASDVSGSYEDSDAGRIGGPAGYYRGVVK